MPTTALAGTKQRRSLPIRSVLSAAKREFDRGNWARGVLLLGLLVLVRTGAVVDLTGRAVGAVRSNRPSSG